MTSSGFSSLSFITPTPSHFLSLALDFSDLINNLLISSIYLDTYHAYLYLLFSRVFLALILTVVIPQVCLCLHRDGRPLTSAEYRAYRTPVFSVYLMTDKITLGSPDPPRPYDTRSHMHTAELPPTPSPSSLCYSFTHAHRSIGYLNIPHPLADSVERLIYLRVYDIRARSTKTTPSPSSLCYSLSHAQRSIGYLNIPQPLSDSAARLISLRVYDSRASSSKSVPSLSSLCYSLTHAHLDLPIPHPPRRPYSTRSHMHTTYTPSPSPRPRSSRSRALRSFGFLHV